MWDQHWRPCVIVAWVKKKKLKRRSPPAAEPWNTMIREGIITHETWKQNHVAPPGGLSVD